MNEFLRVYFKLRPVFDKIVDWHEMNITGWQKYWSGCFLSFLSSFLYLLPLGSIPLVFTTGPLRITYYTTTNERIPIEHPENQKNGSY